MIKLFPIAIIVLTINVAEGVRVSLSKSGCREKRGNVTIPYPFGIGSKCSYNSSFTVVCLQNVTNPPKPYLSSISLEVIKVDLSSKQVTVMQTASPLKCSSRNTLITHLHRKSLVGSPYTLNTPLAVVGCNIEVRLIALRTNSSSLGCRPICGLSAHGCYGINCCLITTTATGPLQELVISCTTYEHGNNHECGCGYAFMADYDWFTDDQYSSNYYNFQNQSNLLGISSQYVPMTLAWDFNGISTLNGQVGITCYNWTRSYLVTLESNIVNKINYIERDCDIGFEGNPYLHKRGFQDIDECM